MKTKTFRTTIMIIACILTFSIQAYSKQPNEYLYLTQESSNLIIGTQNGGVEKIDVRDQLDKKLYWQDFNPILKKVSQLESEGWEIVENHYLRNTDNNNPIMYFLMRRAE